MYPSDGPYGLPIGWTGLAAAYFQCRNAIYRTTPEVFDDVELMNIPAMALLWTAVSSPFLFVLLSILLTLSLVDTLQYLRLCRRRVPYKPASKPILLCSLWLNLYPSHRPNQRVHGRIARHNALPPRGSSRLLHVSDFGYISDSNLFTN